MAVNHVSVDGVRIATDAVNDAGGDIHYQVLKVAFGAEDTVTLVADSAGQRLPITGSLTFSGSIPAGTNNIGDVDVLTLPGSLAGRAAGGTMGGTDVGLPTFAVRKDTAVALVDADGKLTPLTVDDKGQLRVATLTSLRTADSVAAADQIDRVMNGFTELTPKFAKADIAASTTDGSVVAAVASKKIRVLAFRLHCGGTATTATFRTKPAGAGTAITEVFALGANGGRADGYSKVGHFETGVGEGLSLSTGTGSSVGVGVVYVEV